MGCGREADPWEGVVATSQGRRSGVRSLWRRRGRGLGRHGGPSRRLEPGGAGREGMSAAARPLVRPAPRSAMFFPLVVLVAVLPGLYALNSWDLTPPGPWWGLRGAGGARRLGRSTRCRRPTSIRPAVEARAFRTVAIQPPLYAWLEAVGLALSADRDPLASVLPSYVAGVAVVVLVYLHGRLWRGPGLGLVAAVLTGFNRNLLIQMQQATPTTLALAGVLGGPALLRLAPAGDLGVVAAATRSGGAGRSSGRSSGALALGSR